MISFEQFWELHNPHPEYRQMRRFCEKTWNDLAPEKQELIYRTIADKKSKNQFVDYNPYYAIQKNSCPPRRSFKMSYADYYAKYGTTEEKDGWKMVKPQKAGDPPVYYVKSERS